MLHSSIYGLAVPHSFNNHIAILDGVYRAPISLPHAEDARSTDQWLDADVRRERILRDTLQPRTQTLRIGAWHGGKRLGDTWRNDQSHDEYSLSASKMSSFNKTDFPRGRPGHHVHQQRWSLRLCFRLLNPNAQPIST